MANNNMVKGIKHTLTGGNIRQALNDVKGGKAVLDTFKKNLKYIEPQARNTTKAAINRMSKDLVGLKGRVAKEGAKTVGLYAMPLAVPTAGVLGMHKLKKVKKEKTAHDIVDETFVKVAGLQDVLKGNNVKKAINDVKLGKGVVDNFKNNLQHIEADSQDVAKKAVKKMSRNLAGLKGRVVKEGAKTVGAYALPVAGVGAGVYGLNKLKKKEEKTAFDIVDETFEKITK